MSGYALIHRRLLGHHAFRNDAEAMAFAWLVVRASWKPSRVRYKDRIIQLDRGQLAVSIRDFAKAMDRDKAWVERLMKRLRAEAMVKTSDETGVSVVTICKYEDYQRQRDKGETAAEALNGTGARQGQDTEQKGEEVKKISSEANASAVPAPDLKKQVFDLGLSLVMRSGKTEAEARQMVGLWRKGKKDAEVLAGFLDCQAQDISSPLEWLQKRFQAARWVSKSGYEYRGSDEDVLREAERRHDMDIYWTVHRVIRERKEAKAPKPKRGKSASIGQLTAGFLQAGAN